MSLPRFDNAFIQTLPGDPSTAPGARQVLGAAWSRVSPTPVRAPVLLAHSPEMAEALGLADDDVRAPDFAQVFGGNALWPGMEPFATNYGGHQFGNWAGQLGDGRAISLGEAVTAGGARWELQLKGAGPTPYSRFADGRAVLRSSIREFLCSEAMHHLGVPTTRALCLVGTGEGVVRDMFYDGHPKEEPGAIVCRVAPSFLRFGHFELPASRGDVALLRQLAEFCVRRDFPHLLPSPDAAIDAAVLGAWFGEIAERTARMVAGWMRVGFVHGVMNTDNMSVLGLTIDYGPYGWIDAYDPDWTPNTTDRATRRYRFGQQPAVAYWNLGQLANALAWLFDDDLSPLQDGLQRYVDAYVAADRENVGRKLGLRDVRGDDVERMRALESLLAQAEVDMTLWFRALCDLPPGAPSLSAFDDAFYDADKRAAYAGALEAWLRDLDGRVRGEGRDPAERRDAMRAANPRYVLRNWLAQQAIDRAEQGDLGGVRELLEVMRFPYDDQPGRDAFAQRRPEWARTKAGCSMLSCSS